MTLPCTLVPVYHCHLFIDHSNDRSIDPPFSPQIDLMNEMDLVRTFFSVLALSPLGEADASFSAANRIPGCRVLLSALLAGTSLSPCSFFLL